MREWFAHTFPTLANVEAATWLILPPLWMICVAILYGLADAALGINANHGLDAW